MLRLFPCWLLPSLVLLVSFVSPTSVRAQTIAVSEGVQTYASLSGATVTLTGKSELRLTAAAPLAGSVVHLNSPDAWVVFTAVKPSAVVSGYLSQLRVNGAAAISGNNVRVVQYELGAVVIPHAPSFQPLQAFTGPDFSGTSRTFAQYTYYNTPANLGAFNHEISSFKLKRGYMATFSTQANGTGPSQVYIAQDADLEIGRLPAELDNAIRFVRVFPWRWISKKGSCDISPNTLNASWHYNWDNNQNSPLDWEYVPIRQQRWWPGYPDNKPDSTHLLGFNEPDNPVEDAYETLGNGSVDTAIATWPGLLASGLRVGSPAVTDGGLNWLYDFMTKADAAKLRVDYVAIHFYRCGYTAQQLYDWLYDIHVRTGRPIWITEFNNGANWTGCADPTYAQNATRINEFIEMMDNAPWIERYAIYSRVEHVRQMTYDEGGLTPAGVVYRDNVSPLAYKQRLPRTGSRAVSRLSFDGDTLDSSGHGNHPALVGRPGFTTGRNGQALRLDGATQHVQLPPDLASTSAFSFAAWVYWDGGANWQRIFDFGRDTQRYAFLTPSATGGFLRFATRNNGSEQIVQTTSALPVGQWTHVAFTLSGGTGRIYLNGTQAASGSISITPAQLGADLNYLGKSQFPADPLFAGRLDDVRFADHAFSPAQIAAMQGDNTPPQFSSTSLSGGSATQNQPYTGTLAGTATDAEGDTLSFAKVSGPAWLQVAMDGTLYGTPGFSDDGLQEFVVTVSDPSGSTDSAVLTITMPVVSGNGTWISDSDGLWGDITKWTSSFPANGVGSSANFSTLNIAASRTVTLNTSRAIGSLTFGDTSGAQNWTLASANAASLTLDSGVSTTSPAITVVNNTAILSVPLEGENGFTKGGNGTLVLSGGGGLTGTVNIDTGSAITNQGVVRVAHPEAIGGVSTIQIRNNNSGASTLELGAEQGDIDSPAGVSLSGRNNTTVAIRNLSGDNTLGGALSAQSGGSGYFVQSDAGTLRLGRLTSAVSGARTFTFQGPGDFAISGISTDGSAAPLSVIKNGSGRLALEAANTFTGDVTVNGGTLSILGTGALYAGAWNNTAILSVNSGGVLELDRWGYGPNGSFRTQSLGGLSYNPARFVINGGTVRFSGGAAGAPLNPAEAPYGPGFTIGSAGATLDAAKFNDTWTVKFDSRGGGDIVSSAGGTLTLTGVGNGILDKILPGAGGLTKTGSGTWTLPRANSYTGSTAIHGGILSVTGSTSSGSVVVANGGTLAGTGTLGGPASVLTGGTLAPGLAGVGTLTFGGNLTVAAGATVRMELNRAAGTNDRLAVAGQLTLGGTLEVTNLAGTFAAGDAFVLFTGGTRTGAFTTLTLPTLGTGLQWDGSTLATDGILRVQNAPASGFETWAEQHDLPPELSAFDADADGDGHPNGLEYFLGMELVSPDAAPATPELVAEHLSLAFSRRVGATDLTATVQAADSPAGPWTDLARSTGGAPFVVLEDGAAVTETGTGDFRSVEVRDSVPADATHPRRFLRLQLTPTP